MTTIVCALWKNKLYPWDGINIGEIRGKNFTVVIAGKPSVFLVTLPSCLPRTTLAGLMRVQSVVPHGIKVSQWPSGAQRPFGPLMLVGADG